VTGDYSLWTKVRRKGKGPPWPGGPGGPLGTLRRWFLRGRGGGQGLPPPLAEAQSVHRGYGPPGRCFRRVPPEPPGHNKACTPPLFPEGLPRKAFPLDIPKPFPIFSIWFGAHRLTSRRFRTCPFSPFRSFRNIPSGSWSSYFSGGFCVTMGTL